MESKSGKFEKNLNMPVKYLRGIGDMRARWLGKMGVISVLDLMEFFPHTYIQRQLNPVIKDLEPGQRIALTAMISWLDIHITIKNKRQLNVGISDGTTGLMCTWFSYPPAYEKLFVQGEMIWVNGTVTEYNGQIQLVHPDFELLSDKETEDDFWKSRPV